MTGIKSIVFFGTNQTTNTTGETIELKESALWASLGAKASYNKAHLLVDLPTVTTGSTLSVAVWEEFSGVGYVETANSSVRAVRSGQKLWLVNDPGAIGNLNGSTVTQVGSFPLLGVGNNKKIVFTQNSTVASIHADCYFVFVGGQ